MPSSERCAFFRVTSVASIRKNLLSQQASGWLQGPSSHAPQRRKCDCHIGNVLLTLMRNLHKGVGSGDFWSEGAVRFHPAYELRNSAA